MPGNAEVVAPDTRSESRIAVQIAHREPSSNRDLFQALGKKFPAASHREPSPGLELFAAGPKPVRHWCLAPPLLAYSGPC